MIKETITCRRVNRDGSVTEYTQERWTNTEEEALIKKLEREASYREALERKREREMDMYYCTARMSDILDCYEEHLRNVSDFRY